jgi:hypothetical protein
LQLVEDLMSRLWFGFVVLAAGCGTSVRYTSLQSPPHALASRPPSTVEVLEAEPARAYATVGIIETQPDSAYAETRLTPALVDEMRREAARVGCDALVMQGSSPAPAATLGGRAVASVSYRAACAVYTTASR